MQVAMKPIKDQLLTLVFGSLSFGNALAAEQHLTKGMRSSADLAIKADELGFRHREFSDEDIFRRHLNERTGILVRPGSIDSFDRKLFGLVYDWDSNHTMQKAAGVAKGAAAGAGAGVFREPTFVGHNPNSPPTWTRASAWHSCPSLQ